jgi:hypothetical protein
MQVEAQAEPELVDVEEASQPGDEEQDHARIAVGERRAAICLRPLSGVQRHPSDEELPAVELADASDALGPQLVDLLQLGEVHRIRSLAAMASAAGTRHEVDVAHPQRGAALGHPELGGDLGQRPRLRPQRASPLLQIDKPSAAHPREGAAGVRQGSIVQLTLT